ncbi:transcriptional regulator NanR [Rubellimicrobium roseum]|uniref:Transcriptional regulator NanR n=2 Tax=Rubellimicrobium roseum TaxID=687525 RepID=A0A5C4N5Q5_9RHOB|nr:transcriptional regulator NanR [Rubellimicrobium roseum]
METSMTPDAEPIRRRKLSDEVRERLLAQINEGDLRPGDPLPSERELMARYGVGRPAIREAMQQLASLGLIVVRHGDRPRLAAPRLDLLAEQLALTMRHVLTHDDTILAQLKEARIVIETGTARLAAQMRTSADLEHLRDLLARQLLARHDPAEFMRRDGDFHAALAGISGNVVLSSVVRAVFDWMARFHSRAVHSSGLERLTLDEHEAIVAAVAAGDPERAARAMQDHLTRANALYRQASVADN